MVILEVCVVTHVYAILKIGLKFKVLLTYYQFLIFLTHIKQYSITQERNGRRQISSLNACIQGFDVVLLLTEMNE